MPRLISFAFTPEQILARTKTVTRRASATWMRLKPGDVLRAVRKSQGLKKGEKVETLGWIRIVGVSRIPVFDVNWVEVEREGFGSMPVQEFIELLLRIASPRLKLTDEVTRIEFEHVDAGGMR